MNPHIALLDLGTAITDVLAFLGPADQHKLRRTSSAMCEWFDSAAENGSLAFFVTFAPPSAAAAGPLRWRHATANPRNPRPEQEANHATLPATVMVHARNYCLSSFNAQGHGEADAAIIENAAIELVADFAFEHKLVVTGLFSILSIGDGFCKGVKTVEIELKCEDSQLRSVGHEWLSNCPNLKSITISGFGALERVGDFWLYNCSNLQSITFASDMPRLKKVGDSWMSCCENIKHVDLIGLTALEEVGSFWLYNCSSLENVTFARDMPRLKTVGRCWMSECCKLKQVDLTGFTALEQVGHWWMYYCSALERIKFAAHMPNLKLVGSYWMSDCSKLKQVDFTGFTALEVVGDNWLHDCSNVERIMLPTHMPKLMKVGEGWTPQSACSLSDHLSHLSKSGR